MPLHRRNQLWHSLEEGDGKRGLESDHDHSASSEEEEPEIKEAASVRHASYKELTVFPSWTRAQELCESRGGRPGLPVPNKPPVSMDVKPHSTNQSSWTCTYMSMLFII